MTGIKELVWMSPLDLRTNPLNWRRHPGMQREALHDLIYGENGVGWAGAALLNERRPEDGWPKDAQPTLIDGHLRQEVAATHPDEPVPVLVGSWSPEQEKLILASLDPIAAVAEADVAALDELLRQLPTTIDSPPVATLLEDLASKAGVLDLMQAEGGTAPGMRASAHGPAGPVAGGDNDYDDDDDESAAADYDASKVSGAVTGATNLSYILYISFPDEDSFKRGVGILSLGDRSGFVEGQRYANIDGGLYLDQWAAALEGEPGDDG